MRAEKPSLEVPETVAPPTMTEYSDRRALVEDYLLFLRDWAGVGPEVPTENRDIGLAIVEADYEAQVIAIRSVLQRNRKAEGEASERIQELEAKVGGYWAEKEWLTKLHGSTFLDAAHSTAAVGLLAPLLESLFVRAFRYFQGQRKAGQAMEVTHERWRRPDLWDCRYLWKNGQRKQNPPKGILQLAEAIGLIEHLPDDLNVTLSALFAYRNNMLHRGIEWTEKDLLDFDNEVRSKGWTDCFEKATSGDKPWVFYLSWGFVDRCLETVDEIIEGIGAFERPQLYQGGARTP